MKKAPWLGILLLLLVSGCGGTDGDDIGNGSILPQPGNVPVKLALTPSGSDYETLTTSDGTYTFTNMLPGDYFLRAGDRTNSCTHGFPGTSDGEISTFQSDDSIASVTNADVTLETITLHPGACATIIGEDRSGTYALPHRGFNFDSRTFTDNPSEADLFIDISYTGSDYTNLSDYCPSYVFSTNGNNIVLIGSDPQPDIFTTFRALREVPTTGFTSLLTGEVANFKNWLFVVRTLTGNYVKVVTNGWGYRNSNGFMGCFTTLQWQLQPDGAFNFDY